MGKRIEYKSETSDGITLTLPKNIYNELVEKGFTLDVRKSSGGNPQLRKYEDGHKKYMGTLKAYVENSIGLQILDFVDGNRLNFKKSNLIFG